MLERDLRRLPRRHAQPLENTVLEFDDHEPAFAVAGRNGQDGENARQEDVEDVTRLGTWKATQVVQQWREEGEVKQRRR